MFDKIAAHLRRGQYGEKCAAQYLKQQRLKIIAKNVSNRYGEIDIIAKDGDTLVFIEVRTRQSQAMVSALASIDNRKKQKWWRSAQSYLQKHYPHTQPPCRFDVVCVTINGRSQESIDWLKNVTL